MDITQEVSHRTVGASGLIHDENIVQVGIATEIRLLSVNDAEEVFKVALLIHAHFKKPNAEPDPDANEEVRRNFMASVKKFTPDPNGMDGFERVDDYDLYRPKITMVNCVETQFEDFAETVRYNRRTGDIWVSYYNTCTISESLELEKFPFDRQLFRVTFKSANARLRNWSLPTEVLDFPPSRKENPTEDDLKATHLVACELKNWFMASFNVEYFPDDDDPASLTKGEFQVTIRAERDPKFYFFNFFFVMFLIVATNACLVSVSPTDAGDRHAITLTLLLTLVAFKFILIEGTPKVGYLTYMDKYVVLSYLFTMAAVIENIFVAPRVFCSLTGRDICDDDEAAEAVSDNDEIFHIIFSVSWALINAVVFVLCFVPSLIRDNWQTVDDGQIGQTEETVKRTRKIEDGNANEEEMIRRLGIVTASNQNQAENNTVVKAEVPATSVPAPSTASKEVASAQV